MENTRLSAQQLTTVRAYAESLSAYITDQVGKTTFDSPLFALRLYYDSGYYTPFAAVVTDYDRTEAIGRGESPFTRAREVDVYRCMHMREDIGLILSRLYEWGKQPAADIGTEVMKALAARLTTTRMLGRVPVSPDFVAYALDPASPGDAGNLGRQLLACGAGAGQIAEWRNRGWLEST